MSIHRARVLSSNSCHWAPIIRHVFVIDEHCIELLLFYIQILFSRGSEEVPSALVKFCIAVHVFIGTFVEKLKVPAARKTQSKAPGNTKEG
jgi:hypothetical protein